MTFRSIVVTAAVLAATAAFAQGRPDLSKAAKLRNPAQLKEKAPDVYKAKFDTSKGAFVVEVHRDWAPLGADRFYNLVKNGFYDDVRFFRVITNFMVQFGINGAAPVQAIWRSQRIMDDPVKQSNKRGYISFATAGPNTRTTQVFINFRDNGPLDGQGFAPFGQVVEGMDTVVDKLYADYAGAPQNQFIQIENQGNAFLNTSFPKLDYVKKATIEP